MKYAADRPFSDPEKATRRLLEIANATEAIQDGRIHIEDQCPVPEGRRQPGPIRRRPRSRDRARLAVEARVRDLCEVHAGRRRPVRLTCAGDLATKRTFNA